jgi:MFS family permease
MSRAITSGVTNPATPRAYAWIILAVVFLASVAAPLNLFKVPPVMPMLIDAFHMDISNAAWLMSIFAVTGLILAIPAGYIMQRFGPKATGLISVGFVVAGSVIGAISATAASLLLSRFIEGVGMGLIGVVGPAAIAMWFPAEARGLPMGVWSTWVPVGNIVMFNAAPVLARNFGTSAGKLCGGRARYSLRRRSSFTRSSSASRTPSKWKRRHAQLQMMASGKGRPWPGRWRIQACG